jgi:invasion protein IalB
MVCAEAAYRLATRFLRILIATAFAALSPPPGEAGASELIYSPWDKFCFNYVNDLCLVGSDLRLETKCNPVVAGAALLERTSDSKKTLHVTVPNNVRVDDGVRIVVDQRSLIQRPFEKCFPNGCIAYYEAGAELVDRLKHGTMLTIEATSAAGAPVTYRLPLGGFAQAYDGPPREPKVFEEQSGQLQKELQEKEKAECKAEQK